MEAQRTEKQIYTRTLPLTFGGKVYPVPVLKIAEAERWVDGVVAHFGEIEDGTFATFNAFNRSVYDLLFEYAGTSLDPDEILERSDPDEMMEAFLAVWRCACPFGRVREIAPKAEAAGTGVKRGAPKA